jgi:uncharacterized Zn-finger protein
METKDIVLTNQKKIACEGNGKEKNLGHPRVFLNMGEKDQINCPYCGRHFQYSDKVISETQREDH